MHCNLHISLLPPPFGSIGALQMITITYRTDITTSSNELYINYKNTYTVKVVRNKQTIKPTGKN